MRFRMAALICAGTLWGGLATGGIASAGSVGPAPIPPSLGVALDAEQGFSSRHEMGLVPYLFNVKCGPVAYLSSFQIEPYGAWRHGAERSSFGGGLGLSLFVWEPQGRGLGVRILLDGGLYERGRRLVQTGFVLDLDKLVRAGLTVGIGNRPDDRPFVMTSIGTDFVQLGRLLWPPQRPY